MKIRNPAFLLATLSLLAMAPSIIFGLPRGHSWHFNVPWAGAFSSAVATGSWYPRHLPELWNGAGGLDFFFYAPLPFWVSAIIANSSIGLLSSNMAVVLAGYLFLFASAMSFFYFARTYFTSTISLFGSSVYLLAPYHLGQDWYLRQALGEFAVFAFLPLIITSLVKLRRSWHALPVFSLSLAASALSHLPSTLLILLYSGILSIGLSLSSWGSGNSINCGFLLRALIGVALGLALSAFYWLPAILLLGDVSSHVLWSPYFDPIRWLFFDFYPEPNSSMTFFLKVYLILTIVLLCGLSVMGGLRKTSISIISALGVFFVLFLVTPLSFPVWVYSPLKMVQFPWRSFVILDFSFATMWMIIAAHWSQTRRIFHTLTLERILLVLASFLVLCTVYGTILVPLHRYAKFGEAPQYETLTYVKGAREYLPPEAFEAAVNNSVEGSDVAPITLVEQRKRIRELAKRLKKLPVIASSSAVDAIQLYQLGLRHLKIDVDAKEGAIVTLKRFFWKYWIARDMETGRNIQLRPDSEFGFIEFAVAAGRSSVEIELPRFRSEIVGGGIAIFSLVLIVLLSAVVFRRS